jgi:ubiquinone/menaquinone biosynthesis C-methylase UbiE
MPARVDFSPAAASYDGRHGGLSIANASELANAAGIAAGAELLEVGAGTGRVAIPFAGLGFRVAAVEPADGMLQVLREKAGALPVTVLRGEGAKLPLGSAHFDAVLIARLLYVMPDWRDVLAEVRRVLKPGAPFIHEWGNGTPDEEWLQMREKARALFEGAGVVDPFHPGARTEEKVIARLNELGFRETKVLTFEGDLRMTLQDFLDRIVTGQCSYTWNVPQPVKERTLPELTEWAEQRFDLAKEILLPREIIWRIYR